MDANTRELNSDTKAATHGNAGRSYGKASLKMQEIKRWKIYVSFRKINPYQIS
jgi:hypothetical protein